MSANFLRAGSVLLAIIFLLPHSNAAESPVIIETEFGNLVIKTDSQAAPQNVAAFRDYIRRGIYKGSSLDQVGVDFIQGGKPVGGQEGFSKSGNFSYKKAPAGEFSLRHVRGAVGLCRTVGDCNPVKSSNSTQFFICLADVPKDNNEFTVLGHVVSGMEIADKIAEVLRTGTKKSGVAISILEQ